MTYIMRLSDKRPDAAIEAAIRTAIADAQLGAFKGLQFEDYQPRTGFGISGLRARDIAQTNQATGLQGGVAGSAAFGVTAVTVSTWTDWINLSIDDRSYHIVVGVLNRTSTPHITHIRPRVNGEDLPIINLEWMYTWDMVQAFLAQPYIVRPGNNHTMRVFTDATIAGVPAERIGLIGYTLAKRTYLIGES